MAFKIYTKAGDKGETSLFGGKRVPKSHLRVDAYGTVDELNAFVGLLRDTVELEHVRSVLYDVQNRLFNLGALLASDPDKTSSAPGLLPQDVKQLEKEMDQMDETLPSLKNFILPGGHQTVSVCHVCRTVCRRAERLTVALLHTGEPVENIAIQYLNRLSDYFFVLARYLAKDLGVEEMVWKTQ